IAVTAESPRHPRDHDQHNDKDDEEQKTRSAGLAVLFRNRFSRSFVLAPDRFADQIDPGGEAAFITATAEMGLDMVLSDLECRNVRQRTFEAVADLNKHLAIRNEDEQHGAVSFIFLADAPGLGDTLRVIVDRRIALHFRKHGDNNLIRCLTLELRELFVETMSGFLGNDARVIVEVSRWLRRNDFGGA